MTLHQRRLGRRSFLAAGAALALPLGGAADLRRFRAPDPAASAGLSPRRRGLSDLFGEEIRRIPTDDPVVALTFNAAWNDDGIDAVLDELRSRDTPATFFLTGQFAEANPEAAEALAAEHGVASHSYDHPALADLDAAGLREQVERADRAIREATGTDPLPFYRFPYSETSADAVAQVNALGFADIEFTDDTRGYLGEGGGITVEDAVDRAVRAIGPGTILQMHLGATDTSGPNVDSRALPAVIDAVEDRGYTVIDLASLV
ncbi:peptidoglycan/xylan/chitin deacetylase (PgdA/CDA1 family) [Streptomyces sp. TLI_235]|nr:polysaccharide deacetylase family protein [Streptomyces sp. TLI_235]PBC75373.1 peptidoglycan/xylan/chitin deacetylase (PgdA/CDA1 family) [Streptomyces sp. TLI_235]